MKVLGIETSCDETSAAVVVDGREVLSNVVLSQIDLHAPYGGVVPEIASRSHVEYLPRVLEEALSKAETSWDEIGEIAVTYGPGLASSLMVGLSMAKGIAMRLNKPLKIMNHIEAHIYSVFLSPDAPQVDDVCPFTALVVSGGHTSLFRVDGIGRYKLLGQTIDDAAGEAFDKGANLLGLGYPGGPVIDKVAKEGDVKFFDFPRGRVKQENMYQSDLDANLCFTFSGLKTSLMYYLKKNPCVPDDEHAASVTASYQEAIIDALVKKTAKALGSDKTLAVGGGVSLNSRLRGRLKEMAEEKGISLLLAEPKYCGDNAAMIAGLAGAGGGISGVDAMSADVKPSLSL